MNRARLSAIGVSIACLAYDPRAEAAEAKRVVLLVIACAALADLVTRVTGREKISRRPPAHLLCALAFVIVSAVSLAWGMPSGARDLSTWTAAGAIAAFAFSLGFANAVRAARLSAIFVGGASSIAVLAQASLGARGFSLHAGQGNPNWLGMVLAITLPLAIDAAASRATALEKKSATLFAGVAILHFPALFLAHSRTSWIAAGVGIAWLSIAMLRSKKRTRAVSRGSLAIAMLAAFSIAIAISIAYVPHVARASEEDATTAPVDRSASESLRGREWIWRSSLEATERAMPFGVGLGAFPRAYLEAQGHALSAMTPNEAAAHFVNATTAHDEYLQIATESGAAALVLFVLALLFTFRAHVRARWHGGAAVILSLAVLSIADSPIRLPAVAALVALVLGASRGIYVQNTSILRYKKPTIALSITASAILLTTSAGAWASTHRRTNAMDELPDARLSHLTSAAAIDPASGEALVDLGITELAMGRAADARKHLLRARTHVASLAGLIALGHADLAEDDPHAALNVYESALAWDPGSLRARVGHAQALVAIGDLDAAYEEAHIATLLAPGDLRVRALRAEIRDARVNQDVNDTDDADDPIADPAENTADPALDP